MKIQSRFFLGIMALVVGWGCMASASQAQGLTIREALDTPVAIVPVAEVVSLADLASWDLSGMSSAWWKDLKKAHKRLLRSSDAKLKERALQNIIFFAKMYPDVDFTRIVSSLFKIYRYDENEDHRIMALAALGNIGHRNVIKLLREDLRYETSERVRTQTLYVLADYYNKGSRR